MSAEQEENVKNAKFTRLMQALQAGQIDQKTFKEAINKDNLLGVTLDTSQDTLDGYEDNTVGGDDDESNDTDNPGANRADSSKPKATETGGAPKGQVKETPQSKPTRERPAEKTETKKPKDGLPKTSNADFDESKHPRADDGKFGSGGGSAEMSAFKKKNPSSSGEAFHSKGTKDDATAKARKLREEGIHATIWHMEGPKSGAKSQYFVMVPESKKNVAPEIMPKRWNRIERAGRTLMNSAAFDLASYRADGGDDWINPARKELFENPINVDKALWAKAKEASLAAWGRDRWQFIVWWYKKQGGKFQ